MKIGRRWKLGCCKLGIQTAECPIRKNHDPCGAGVSDFRNAAIGGLIAILRNFGWKYVAAVLAVLAFSPGGDAARAGQPGMDLALCVGAGDYRHFPALSSPYADTLALSRELDTIGDFRRIVVLADLSSEGGPNQTRLLPTHKNIVDMLALFARTVPPNAGILVYLRGYAEMKDGQARYLPVDALPGGGIPIQEIVDILDSGKAARKIILLDAANPDPDGAAPSGDVPSFGNTVVVYSHEDEQSPLLDRITSRSLFSRAIEDLFLELDGEVSLTADGFMHHVNRYMSEYCLDNFILAGQAAVMRGSDGELEILNARPRTAGKRSAVLSVPGAAPGRTAAAPPTAAANRPAAPAPSRAAIPAAPGRTVAAPPMVTANRPPAPTPPPAAVPAAPAARVPAPDGEAAISPKARNQRFNAEKLFDEKHYDRALPLFLEAAEAGDPVSENYLGDLYFEGLGVENDFAEAMRRYRRAAEAGNASAQDNLGFMLEHGVGVAADPAQAAEWYARAHAQGYAPAAYHLARLHAAGQGVEKDAARARRLLDEVRGEDVGKLFLKAAGLGFTRGQYELALFHHEGVVVKKDARQAAEWFKKVAENERAEKEQLELGDIMHGFSEATGDYEAAIELYKQACVPVFAMGGK